MTTADAWLRRGVKALVVLAIMAGFAPAGAAQRKALLIGNGAYLHTATLANTINDARDLGARLESLGYQVTVGIDLPRQAFLSTFQNFVRSLKADDVVLLFFAGHGIQIGGENYLFPVDAQVTGEADASKVLVPLNALLADLARVARQRIVVLDACRDNPFAKSATQSAATRSIGAASGLARVYDGVGSFLAFSTQPGNVALDGSGRNSPFTTALLRHIGEPQGDVHAVMRRVRADVQSATGNQQVPWENSSLIEDVTFGGAIIAKPPASPAVASAVTPAGATRPIAPSTARTQTPTEVYHYVSGLDAKGDNFLALRNGSGADAQRIATMGPNTLLKVIGEAGPWRNVVLRDGTMGWAHSNWITCCRSELGADSRPSVTPAVNEGACDALWTERNAIWKRYGYCFTTERAQRVFSNRDCSRDQASASTAMTIDDRSRVQVLLAREQQIKCR